MTSSVFSLLRLKMDTACPRLSIFQARLRPITAMPITPIFCLLTLGSPGSGFVGFGTEDAKGHEHRRSPIKTPSTRQFLQEPGTTSPGRLDQRATPGRGGPRLSWRANRRRDRPDGIDDA